MSQPWTLPSETVGFRGPTRTLVFVVFVTMLPSMAVHTLPGIRQYGDGEYKRLTKNASGPAFRLHQGRSTRYRRGVVRNERGTVADYESRGIALRPQQIQAVTRPVRIVQSLEVASWKTLASIACLLLPALDD